MLIAARELGLTGEQLDVLVDLLGMPEPKQISADLGPPQIRPEERVPNRSTPWPTQPLTHHDLADLRDSRTIVDELPSERVELGGVLVAGLPLDPVAVGLPPLPWEPPIPAYQLRAALLMLLRRDRTSDQYDIEAAVDLVAEQRPLARPPRLVEQSTYRGATVLADVGSAMLPYLDDVTGLVEEIAHLVGESALTVHWVEDGTPRDVGELDLEPGRPILILSTLGAVHPTGASAGAQGRWLSLTDVAGRAGADVIALVPHQTHRWPPAIRRSMQVVAWENLVDVGRCRE